METKKLNGKGVGSLSPKYHVSPEFPNKILTIKHVPEIDNILNNDIETKISIYEDRTRGWFLDFARELTKKEHSEFIVLMICVSYLEGNQQFREGKISTNESTDMLEKALKRIFPDEQEDTLSYFVNKIRHGLFHDGMTRRGVLLTYDQSIPIAPFTLNNKSRFIRLNPSLVLKAIEIDFELYINILKNPINQKERGNFEKHYNELYEETSAH